MNDKKIKDLKWKIENTYVDRYNSHSVAYYNALVKQYNSLVYQKNKCLNNNCVCQYNFK